MRPGTIDDGPFDRVPRAAAAILAGDLNFKPDEAEHVRLMSPIDAATPAYRDAWELAHPGQPHDPTVALHDQSQFPGPPFTWDYVLVSADLAARLRDVRVDAVSDASDHQPVMLEWD